MYYVGITQGSRFSSASPFLTRQILFACAGLGWSNRFYSISSFYYGLFSDTVRPSHDQWVSNLKESKAYIHHKLIQKRISRLNIRSPSILRSNIIRLARLRYLRICEGLLPIFLTTRRTDRVRSAPFPSLNFRMPRFRIIFSSYAVVR